MLKPGERSYTLKQSWLINTIRQLHRSEDDKFLFQTIEDALLTVSIHQGLLLRYDSEHQKIAIAHHWGMNPELIMPLMRRTFTFQDDSLISAIYLQSTPTFVERLSDQASGKSAFLFRSLQMSRFWTIPLMAGDRWLGVLVIEPPEDSTPTPLWTQNLGLLAEVLAMKMEHIALKKRNFQPAHSASSEELAKKVRQLSILNEIRNTAGSSLRTSELLEHIVLSLTQKAKFERALLLVRSQEGYQFEGIIGDQHSCSRFSVEDLPMPRFGGQTYQELTHHLVNHPQTAKLVDVNTLVAIPLIVRERMVGILGVDNHVRGQRLNKDDVELLFSIGTQIEIAIDNARLYENMKQNALGFKHLFEVATAFNATLDYEQTIQLIVDKMADSLSVSQCDLIVMTPLGEMRIAAATSLLHPKDTRIDLHANPPLQQALLLKKPQTFARERSPEMRCLAYRQALIIPLYLRQKPVGIICLGETDPGGDRPFSNREIQLAQTIANQAAISLENAQLYQGLEERVIERTIELKEANLALQARQRELELMTQQLQAMIRSIPDGLLVLDNQRQIIVANPVFNEHFKVTSPPIRGAHISDVCDLMATESREKIGQFFIEICEEPGRFIERELDLSGSATPRVFKVLAAPILDLTKEVMGQVIVFHDITRERELDHLKSEFVSTVSHELRTPLSAMIGFATLLEDGIAGELSEEQLEYLHKILFQGERLLKLINDLLDFSRLEAGQMPTYPQLFDVGDILIEVTEVLRPLVEEKRMRLELTIMEGLPPIEMDPDKFRQILFNLLGNAIKFSPEDKGLIEVKAYDRNYELCIQVTDNGIGISPEHQVKLFESFYQVDNSSTRQYSGTGLGLAIVLRLVQLHGGRIWLESEMGHGSSFFFTVPYPEKT